MELAPASPELFVIRVMFEEIRNFINVRNTHARAQQMTERMQRRIAQTIARIEHRHALSLDPAVPECLNLWSIDTFGTGVPEAKVKVHRTRNVGIKVVATPLPGCLTDHGSQMVDGQLIGSVDRLVTEFLQRFS